MLANNETGAIQPVQQVVMDALEHNIPVHTDAVQAVGRIRVDFHALGVTTLAASAHKFHGPAGVGFLLIRADASIAPTLFGGGQQRGLRPGTPPVALIVGMATALNRWQAESTSRINRWKTFRDRLEHALINTLRPKHVIRHGPQADELRLPQTLNLGFEGIDGDSLLMPA